MVRSHAERVRREVAKILKVVLMTGGVLFVISLGLNIQSLCETALLTPSDPETQDSEFPR
jgi:hypothetical protein